MSVEFDLTKATGRSCFWVPDFAFLSLLKPIFGRTLQIGPSVRVVGADSSNQTLAASTAVSTTINFNTNTAGTLAMPGANQVYLWESMSGTITAEDASGKLQISRVVLYLNGGFSFLLGPMASSLPWTFPALVSNWTLMGQFPIPLQYGQPVDTNGPSFNTLLVNTDASNSHTYRRQITGVYRLVDNVDLSWGPSVPGAGVGL